MPDNKTIQECINVTQRYKEIEKVYNKNEDLASLQFVEENSLSLLKKIKKSLEICVSQIPLFFDPHRIDLEYLRYRSSVSQEIPARLQRIFPLNFSFI